LYILGLERTEDLHIFDQRTTAIAYLDQTILLGRDAVSTPRRHRLTYLLPYSPDLNPIKKSRSKHKPILRVAKARSDELLDRATGEPTKLITPEDAKGWFRLGGAGL
jgi:transposase